MPLGARCYEPAANRSRPLPPSMKVQTTFTQKRENKCEKAMRRSKRCFLPRFWKNSNCHKRQKLTDDRCDITEALFMPLVAGACSFFLTHKVNIGFFPNRAKLSGIKSDLFRTALLTGIALRSAGEGKSSFGCPHQQTRNEDENTEKTSGHRRGWQRATHP